MATRALASDVEAFVALVDVANQLHHRIFDPAVELFAQFCAGSTWISPDSGARGSPHRARIRLEVGQYRRKCGRLKIWEVGPFLDGRIEVDKLRPHGHDRAGFSDVGVEARREAEIGLELLWRKRLPVRDAPGPSAFGQARRYVHTRHVDGEVVGVVAVHEDDPAPTSLGQGKRHVLDKGHECGYGEISERTETAMAGRDAVVKGRCNKSVEPGGHTPADLRRND